MVTLETPHPTSFRTMAAARWQSATKGRKGEKLTCNASGCDAAQTFQQVTSYAFVDPQLGRLKSADQPWSQTLRSVVHAWFPESYDLLTCHPGPKQGGILEVQIPEVKGASHQRRPGPSAGPVHPPPWWTVPWRPRLNGLFSVVLRCVTSVDPVVPVSGVHAPLCGSLVVLHDR